MKIKRLKNLLFIHFARLPMKGKNRAKCLKMGGDVLMPRQIIFLLVNMLFLIPIIQN